MQLEFTKNRFTHILGSVIDYINTLKDGEYTLTIDKKKRPRSLRSNNYSWLLTDKLSDVMVIRGVKISKDEMHAEMIFRYGQPMLDANGEVVIYSTSQDVKMPEFFPYAKEIGTSEPNGKMFTHYRIYRGSHEYSSQEMSVFISGIVEECKEQGIQTETPEEIARMISLMESEERR